MEVEKPRLLEVDGVAAGRKDVEPRVGRSARIMSDGSTHGASWSPTMMSVGVRRPRSPVSSSWTVLRFDMTSRVRCAQAWASCSPA